MERDDLHAGETRRVESEWLAHDLIILKECFQEGATNVNISCKIYPKLGKSRVLFITILCQHSINDITKSQDMPISSTEHPRLWQITTWCPSFARTIWFQRLPFVNLATLPVNSMILLMAIAESSIRHACQKQQNREGRGWEDGTLVA